MSKPISVVELRKKLYEQVEAITAGTVNHQEANTLIKTSNAIIATYRLQLESVRLVGNNSEMQKTIANALAE